MSAETAGKAVSKTTLFHDAAILQLMRAREELNGYTSDSESIDASNFEGREILGSISRLKEDETALLNVLDSLSRGFDPVRFEEILGVNSGNSFADSPRHASFFYRLKSKEQETTYVMFGVSPFRKEFYISEHRVIGQRYAFCLHGVTIKNISYEEQISYITESGKTPIIIVRGLLGRIHIEVALTRTSIRIVGSSKISDLAPSQTKPPLYWSLPLQLE